MWLLCIKSCPLQSLQNRVRDSKKCVIKKGFCFICYGIKFIKTQKKVYMFLKKVAYPSAINTSMSLKSIKLYSLWRKK